MRGGFAYFRHGYRSTNTTTPQLILHIGDSVTPSSVNQPSFGGSFAGALLNNTLSHTLPNLVKKTVELTHLDKSHAYADSSSARCQQTAMGWASILKSKKIGGTFRHLRIKALILESIIMRLNRPWIRKYGLRIKKGHPRSITLKLKNTGLT